MFFVTRRGFPYFGSDGLQCETSTGNKAVLDKKNCCEFSVGKKSLYEIVTGHGFPYFGNRLNCETTTGTEKSWTGQKRTML